MSLSKRLDNLIKRRERLFVKIQLCYDLIKDLPDKKKTFLARCQDLSQLNTSFELVTQELDNINTEIEPESDKVDTANPSKQFDILFYEIKAVYEETMESDKKTQSNSSNTTPTVTPKLPQIDISKFSGQLEQFNSFKSLFDNLIHSTSMAPIEKFSYLKSLLEGPALSVVEAIPFDPDHYELAYQTLIDRYTNPRILATYYLNKILDQQPIKTPSLSSLRQLIDVFNINVQALKTLKINDLSGFIFLQLALRTLDGNTRKTFEQEFKSKTFPDFNNLMEFLRSQCAIYEITKDNSKPTTLSKPSAPSRKVLMTTQPKLEKSEVPVNTAKQDQLLYGCPLCKNDHKLYRCSEFLTLTPSQRLVKVRSLKRCFSCLGSHMVSSCASSSSCRYCKSKKHNSLLHDKDFNSASAHNSSESPSTPIQKPMVTEAPSSVTSATAEQPVQTLSCRSNRNEFNTTTMLSTAQVLIQTALGNWQPCRAVIDGGSQVNFVTSSLAQSLKLPIRKCSIDINGIGQMPHSSAKGVITCNVSSRLNKEDNFQCDAVIIPKISSELPAAPLPGTLKKRFSSLTLADPDFNRPAKVDMLLGVQAFTEILTDGFSFIKGQPSALHTIFGWVLMGDVLTENISKPVSSLFVSSPSTDQLLRKFWELEEVTTSKPLDPEAQACEQHFKSTISRDDSGRYIASLPFKDGKHPNLGSNRELALRKFQQLEKRFHQQPELKEQYTKCLQDYLDQNHMSLASQTSSYLLTHHGVKKDSSTSPLRVVFNASEISDTNNSLNKSLMTGPKLQTDIGHVITNFRLNPIALTCDIKQMYRAIHLSPEDRQYQHILWRMTPSSSIQEWELQRLTFGVSSSPYIAQRTLQQLVEDEGSNFPQAAEALSSSCYIDDIVTGASSENEAMQLYTQLTKLLQAGGFELHKWTCSNSNVLKSIPEIHREAPHPLGSTHTIKVLGLQWDPTSDSFGYSITPIDKTPTKRNVLSQVARVYDVNGYISPVIFTLKHLLQQLWIEQLDWDDPLPNHLEKKWSRIVLEIPLLHELQIPRYILSTYLSVQLIGFSDASTTGLCAALYLRVRCDDNSYQCHLINSKTKVAPLKPLTVPRLELCAALLLSRLVESNTQLMTTMMIHETFLFTDSMNVLSWIRTNPHLLDTFVSNRVCKIIEKTPSELWHHVSGEHNPADCGTRGLLPSQILQHSLWWHGPPFLTESETSWPVSSCDLPIVPQEPKTEPNTTLTTQTVSNYLYEVMYRYSTLTKLVNVMSYVQRFIFNLRNLKVNRRYGPISVTERRNATQICVKLTQTHHYAADISALKQGKECSKSMRPLSPFLSQDTLMVGGRLRFAPLPETTKHPYLIPTKSHFAELLCYHYHLHSLHGGPKLVQSLIQRHYWIPGARNLIRKCIFKCLPCYKLKAKPIQPYMSDIPISRFRQGRCFENVGLDFAGPFMVKESTRRNSRLTKCYIALFVCMSVKAIHLELVSALTTDACLAAIDRFISRRGLPQNIYSDQGSNFIGASNQIKEVYDLLQTNNSKISEYLAKQEITWNFNPPHAANFGGIWEAGVKSTKHHLKRILGESHFTAEEFTTFLCRIEAILNSRPLCPLSNSPTDGFDYLSPGHFLIGSPLLARPEEDVTEEPSNHLTRWKMVSQATQLFWKKWSKDYLHTLIQRPKWATTVPNLKEGDLVLMYQSNLYPLRWPLGRIEKVYPGKDNVVRVVKLRTSTGSFTRPVNKLVRLPIV